MQGVQGRSVVDGWQNFGVYQRRTNEDNVKPVFDGLNSDHHLSAYQIAETSHMLKSIVHCIFSERSKD